MLSETKNNLFNRQRILTRIKNNKGDYDIIIIGGGATGLGTALDASSRGFKTLLIEQGDFAKGTSSRSTKLAHGGVRYLAQGNISLVFEALYERGLMIKNAPHLVNMLPFVIPSYKWWQKYFYGAGLKIYDWMARKLRLQKTRILNRESVKILLPNLQQNKLNGGVLYYDGQFDDTRLAIEIAKTAAEYGCDLINYMKAEDLLKDEKGKVCGIQAKDIETGKEYHLNSKVVINATGVFVDNILKMNAPEKSPRVKASQGIHLVLNKSFLKGEQALMIPSTSDGRVLFAVPWHDHLLVGTTDTLVETHNLEPVALESEIDFVINTLGNYLTKKPNHSDILSVFAGLRPLVQPDKEKGTKEISRDHKLSISESNLITITGGKWTTYRRMAEDTVDAAINIAGLKKEKCRTASLRIHGYSEEKATDHLSVYGSDAVFIRQLLLAQPVLNEKIHPEYPYIKAEIIWAVQNEMARTIEDILARRLRFLFLNARAAIDAAPVVAQLMADELSLDENWKQDQIKNFTALAQNYLTESYFASATGSEKLKI